MFFTSMLYTLKYNAVEFHTSNLLVLLFNINHFEMSWKTAIKNALSTVSNMETPYFHRSN